MFYNPLECSIIYIGNEWQIPSAYCRYDEFFHSAIVPAAYPADFTGSTNKFVSVI